MRMILARLTIFCGVFPSAISCCRCSRAFRSSTNRDSSCSIREMNHDHTRESNVRDRTLALQEGCPSLSFHRVPRKISRYGVMTGVRVRSTVDRSILGLLSRLQSHLKKATRMNGSSLLDRLNFKRLATNRRPEARDTDIKLSREILELSRADKEAIWKMLRATPDGLDPAEAKARLASVGPNLIAKEGRPSVVKELWGRAKNPLNALLLSLATVSYFLSDIRAAVVIVIMVVLAITTAFVQEHRSNDAAAQLRAMVKTTASVKRRGVVVPGEEDQSQGFSEIAMDQLVPGDIVRLSSGDMIPADLRLLSAKDLFINQAALTGEAMPSEKSVAPHIGDIADPFNLPNLCFMGGSVVSGFGIGVIAHTGAKTYFGQLADQISGRRELTSFDKGINRFTWLMIRFILVMVPAVLLINGFTKGDWLEALLFAVAVAVGLTPEMLPMIVTVNLAKGAIAMSKRRVIVKRLHAIQNFGAMDVLCTDKTGTLTQACIILKWHLDIRGNECERVLEFAYLNSHYQSGLKNLLDVAVLQHIEMGRNLHLQHQYQIIDEIPFDFVRRRLSVILSREDNTHVLICKGAVEEIFSVCTHDELGAEWGTLDASHLAQAQAEARELNDDGKDYQRRQ